MPKVNLNEVDDSGRPFLKRGSFTVRVMKTELKKSKKGNPMLVFNYEIVSPEIMEITSIVNGEPTTKPVKISGLSLMDYITLNEFGLARLKALHKAGGFPMDIDTDKPDTDIYRGKGINVYLSSENTTLLDEQTNEPVVDDDGNVQQTVQYKIQRFLGRAPQFDADLPY